MNTSHQGSSTATELLALLAIAAPVLMAYNQTPSVTFYNQVLALAGWGLWAAWLVLERAVGGLRGLSAGVWALLLALGALMISQALAPMRTGVTWGLPLQALGMTAAAGVALTLGARIGRGPQAEAVTASFCWALVIASLGSAAFAFVQVFIPSLAGQGLIASSSVAGRAVGNLRQPNHLSTLVLMGAAAAVWLGARPRGRDSWPAGVVAALLLVFTWVVVVTGSRTGMVGIVMLALWGLADRELPRGLRPVMMALPVAYGMYWVLMAGWSHLTGHDFIGEARLHSGSDISSSRFGIWSNTLSLIASHPWAGVGWGGFNHAWTLTAFPGRPIAFFDHTHNLVLQMLVELGLPAGLFVLLLFGVALWALLLQALRRTLGTTPRLALFIVALLMVHSQLEYPLWYAYFLLPTAFVWGLGLEGRPSASFGGAGVASKGIGLALAGVAVAVGAGLAIPEYRKITEIYAPTPGNPQTLAQRIALGQRSILFGYQADYAEVTTADHPGAPDIYPSFRGATHNLLDARLMAAWAKAEAERGEVERARFLAHRLAEFKHPLGRQFLAPCLEGEGAASQVICGPDAPLGPADFRGAP